MLSEEKKTILHLLIAMAWSDGRVDEEELEVVEALLDAFGADQQQAEEIRDWARTPRSLEDVDVSTLSVSDLELTLQHAVLLSYLDGEQSEKEVELLDRVMDKLGFTREAAAPILEAASERARALLPDL
jgi:uncharacterized membrane protein YebE (DUF533 family)